MFVQLFSLTKMKLTVFFPPSLNHFPPCFDHVLLYPERGTTAQLYPDRDALEFSKGLVTKNQSPCLV